MTPAQAVGCIQEAWKGAVLAEAHLSTAKRTHVWASTFRPCTRRMVFDMTQPENEPAFEQGEDERAEKAARWRKGRERERSITAFLQRVGEQARPEFVVEWQQSPIQIEDEEGRTLITGKMDGCLNLGDGLRPPFEVKSGVSFQRISCLEDLERSLWTRHVLPQMLCYLHATSQPWGLLILDQPALPLLLPVVMADHRARWAEILQQAKEATAVARGEAQLPGYIDDPAECGRCPHFGRVCAPPFTAPGLKMLESPHLEQLVQAVDATTPQARDHRHCRQRLSEALKVALPEGGKVVIGPYVLTAGWQKRGDKEHGAFRWELARLSGPGGGSAPEPAARRGVPEGAERSKRGQESQQELERLSRERFGLPWGKLPAACQQDLRADEKAKQGDGL